MFLYTPSTLLFLLERFFFTNIENVNTIAFLCREQSAA